MTDTLDQVIKEIKTSEIYEKASNWEARGLNQSDDSIIIVLRTATNNFLKN